MTKNACNYRSVDSSNLIKSNNTTSTNSTRTISNNVAPLDSLTFPQSSVKETNKIGASPKNVLSKTSLSKLTAAQCSFASATLPQCAIPIENKKLYKIDDTIIVETDKDVYINTVENIVEQKYISNITGGVLQVGEITGTCYNNIANCIYKLGFDTDSGFEVSDLGSGIAKIAMNSTFKYWEVDGNPGLVACGLDTVNFVAGCNISITSCNTAVPKTLTINSTGGGGVSLDAYCSLAIGNGLSSSTGYNNFAFGYNTLCSNTTGSNNIAFGYGALRCNITGAYNIAIGIDALYCNIAGATNIAIGERAMAGNCVFSSGYTVTNNIALGTAAMYRCVVDSIYNIAIGEEAHSEILYSCQNINLGLQASQYVYNAVDNITIGSYSGSSLMNACLNIGLGRSAVGNACNAERNIGIGYLALLTAHCSCNNIALGYGAGRNTIGTTESIFLGTSAGYYNRYSRNNIAIGECALYGPATFSGINAGNYNIGIGSKAGSCITSGANNTIIGSLTGTAGLVCTVLIGADTCERIKVDNNGLCINGAPLGINFDIYCSFKAGSGLSSSTGMNNVSIGYNSLFNNSDGSNNISIGYYSLVSNTNGSNNIVMGFRALESNSTGSFSVAIGQYAGFLNRSATITAVGDSTLSNNTTGARNVAVGSFALNSNSTGSCNTGIGYDTLMCNSIGCNNVALGNEAHKWGSTGSNNVAVGSFALTNNTGCSNTALGTCAGAQNTTGFNNTVLGICAGCSITTGSNNTIIGTLAGSAGLVCTVLIGAGTCERIKVDNNGLCINGALLANNNALTIKNTYEALSSLTGATGVVTHNMSNGSIFNHTSISANFTANFTNLGLSTDYATNAVLVLNQGATAYISNSVQIAGVAQTINWQGGSAPSGTANKKDIVSFSITNIGGTYTVFGQLVSFG